MPSPYTVHSNQSGAHEKLTCVVKKHLHKPFQHTPSESQVNIFKQVHGILLEHSDKPWLLDSGCGTGMSTAIIAEQNPEALVLGVDKSLHRLSKHPQWQGNGPISSIGDNAFLIHANLIDFWFLSKQVNVTYEKHFILYPNPWPKAKQLKRRFHGHPIFPYLVGISKEIELRSNWKIYLEEFQLSLKILFINSVIDRLSPESNPVSLFEAKYHQSQEPCFSLTA